MTDSHTKQFDVFSGMFGDHFFKKCNGNIGLIGRDFMLFTKKNQLISV